MRRVSQVPLPLCENSVAAQYQAAHTLLTFTTALLRLNGLDCIYMMEHFLVRDMSFFGGWEVSQGNPPPPPIHRKSWVHFDNELSEASWTSSCTNIWEKNASLIPKVNLCWLSLVRNEPTFKMFPQSLSLRANREKYARCYLVGFLPIYSGWDHCPVKSPKKNIGLWIPLSSKTDLRMSLAPPKKIIMKCQLCK